MQGLREPPPINPPIPEVNTARSLASSLFGAFCRPSLPHAPLSSTPATSHTPGGIMAVTRTTCGRYTPTFPGVPSTPLHSASCNAPLPPAPVHPHAQSRQ